MADVFCRLLHKQHKSCTYCDLVRILNAADDIVVVVDDDDDDDDDVDVDNGMIIANPLRSNFLYRLTNHAAIDKASTDRSSCVTFVPTIGPKVTQPNPFVGLTRIHVTTHICL